MRRKNSMPLLSPKQDLIRVGWDLDSVQSVGDKLTSIECTTVMTDVLTVISGLGSSLD
jgi:hypothetical protein